MGISTTPTRVARLVSTTYDHFAAAESLLRSLKWAEFGKEVAAVKAGLKELRDLTSLWEDPFLTLVARDNRPIPRRGGG